jgi:hypothetical protein
MQEAKTILCALDIAADETAVPLHPDESRRPHSQSARWNTGDGCSFHARGAGPLAAQLDAIEERTLQIAACGTATGRATIEALRMNDPIPHIARSIQMHLDLLSP